MCNSRKGRGTSRQCRRLRQGKLRSHSVQGRNLRREEQKQVHLPGLRLRRLLLLQRLLVRFTSPHALGDTHIMHLLTHVCFPTAVQPLDTVTEAARQSLANVTGGSAETNSSSLRMGSAAAILSRRASVHRTVTAVLSLVTGKPSTKHIHENVFFFWTRNTDLMKAGAPTSIVRGTKAASQTGAPAPPSQCQTREFRTFDRCFV